MFTVFVPGSSVDVFDERKRLVNCTKQDVNKGTRPVWVRAADSSARNRAGVRRETLTSLPLLKIVPPHRGPGTGELASKRPINIGLELPPDRMSVSLIYQLLTYS